MIKTAIICADIHFPKIHNPTINIIKKIGRDLKPDYLVLLGDVFDANGISKYTKKTVENGILDTYKEIELYKKLHYKLVAACGGPKVYWTKGNHCGQRINDLKGYLEEINNELLLEIVEDKLNLEKQFPTVEFCEYNQTIKIGKLFLTHGEFHCNHHAAKHVDVYDSNIMFGHLHTTQIYTKVGKSKGKPYQGISIPACCELNPEYMKNKASKWINGFAIVYFMPSGEFFYQILQVINGNTIFNGKVYNG